MFSKMKYYLMIFILVLLTMPFTTTDNINQPNQQADSFN
jgi:hypothetical protein